MFLVLIFLVTFYVLKEETRQYTNTAIVKLTLDQEKQQLVGIYDNLRKYTGVPTVPLVIIDDDEINAWTNGQAITFTSGILDKLGANKDEIALVLGHEMSHVMLKHLTNLDPTLTQVEKEAQADKMGAYFMLRAGYNICEGRKFFLMLNNLDDGDFADPANAQHPSNSYRYYALSFPWCD